MKNFILKLLKVKPEKCRMSRMTKKLDSCLKTLTMIHFHSTHIYSRRKTLYASTILASYLELSSLKNGVRRTQLKTYCVHLRENERRRDSVFAFSTYAVVAFHLCHDLSTARSACFSNAERLQAKRAEIIIA